jgi:hypothetical protein
MATRERASFSIVAVRDSRQSARVLTRNTQEEQAEQDLPAEEGLGDEVFRTLAAVASIGAVLYGLWYGFTRPGAVATSPALVDIQLTTKSVRELCLPPSSDGRPVAVEMLYSDDKRAWIGDAADRFARLCPTIKLKLRAMGDIESADAILAGDEKPALWSPADDLVVRYLEASAKDKGPDIHIGEQISIAHSPLVVLTWEDQERVLEEITAAIGRVEGPWAAMVCAHVPRDPDLKNVQLQDMVPGRWIDWYKAYSPRSLKKKKPTTAAQTAPKAAPGDAAAISLEQIESWGRVKFTHASPRRSAAGLETLYMMVYDYTFPPNERAAALMAGPAPAAPADPRSQASEGGEHLRDEFQRRLSERKDALHRWLRRCEAGLDESPSSAEHLTASMYKHGHSEYDFVATYEQLVFSQLKRSERNESSMDELRVIYPQLTIINRHPVVSLLPEGPDHDLVRLASKRWIDFLRSDAIQKLAIEHGFRPATDTVKISEHRVPANQFLRSQPYGISFDKPLMEPPRLDGKAIQEIIRLWEDATGEQ